MKKILILLFAVMLSACSNIGGNADKFESQYVKSNLIVGKTTQDQVIAAFGSPDSKSLDNNGNETWLYRKDEGFDMLSAVSGYIPGGSAAAGANDARNDANEKGTYNRLWVSFNKKGIVTSWNM
ncbi:hypothetical protein [Zophobihabitans entericus]|uniref:Lipoprotein SmpA/OmlA domain-containing protein n=1 Tax=Zophobihabitans entericus TaxID=1635327 RepID=A0A6G9IC10_9GAMM|nr:hypothetical protein [Zophobihabitans entericus]QIQ21359.1 hypothetical protein IPMB12_06445 [Zophobihabitans entericus]